jgi:release factor glutamine methyltransferase
VKTDPTTIGNCLKRGAGWLHFGPHPKQARPDAEILLRLVLGRDRAWLMAHGDDKAEPNLWPTYFALLSRRLRGEPIQYIAGETEFYGLPFRVTTDVLIPRPETEILVEKAIEVAGCRDQSRIVDVGTGSGCIAVALAKALNSNRITAIDSSPTALEVARDNAQRNGVNVRFLAGNLLTPVADELFDLVLSNPPYVAEADRASLAVEVREFEPARALFAGEDGLDIYRRLIPAAHAVLVPGGSLALEIGFSQAKAIEVLLSSSGFQNIEFTPDLQGIPRVASARRS